MIIKNKIVKRIILSIKFLILLGILLNSLLYSIKILYIRYGGHKINVVVENVHSNGFRSSYFVGEVLFREGKGKVVFCPSNIKNGTEIEVYRSDLLNTMLYAGISKGTIFFQFMVLIISIVAIYSLLFMKDDES